MTEDRLVERLKRPSERLADESLGDLCLAAAATIESLQAEVERLRAWALDKASTHHRLAHENPNLRSEHIASSSAYRSIAEEIARAALAAKERTASSPHTPR